MKFYLALIFGCILAVSLVMGQEGEESSDVKDAGDEAKKPFTGQCYQCVSAYDTNCTNEFPAEKYKVDCNSQQADYPTTNNFPKNVQAIGCRKTEQEIPDGYRYIRECAYSGEEVSGLKRTGNKGVRSWYYHCTEDYCNGAGGQSLATGLFLVVALLSFLQV